MTNKLDRIMTSLDGLLPIMSHDPLITWPCEIRGAIIGTSSTCKRLSRHRLLVAFALAQKPLHLPGCSNKQLAWRQSAHGACYEEMSIANSRTQSHKSRNTQHSRMSKKTSNNFSCEDALKYDLQILRLTETHTEQEDTLTIIARHQTKQWRYKVYHGGIQGIKFSCQGTPKPSF